TTNIGPWAAPTGVVYGINTGSGGLVVWDRWACDNHNTVILARSGAGKSYLAKLDLLRSLYQGVEVAVVDPEDEYHPLSDPGAGASLHLGPPDVHLTPPDPPPHPTAPEAAADALAERAIAAHTLTALMLARPLPPGERAALDRAVITAYTTA